MFIFSVYPSLLECNILILLLVTIFPIVVLIITQFLLQLQRRKCPYCRRKKETVMSIPRKKRPRCGKPLWCLTNK